MTVQHSSKICRYSEKTVTSLDAALTTPEVIALTERLHQWHGGSWLGISTLVAGHMPLGHWHRLLGVLTKQL